MAKFSKKTTEKIVGLIKSDTYTIAEICRQVGIAPRTYHSWIEDNPEFAKAVEDANVERMQLMAIEAKKSLLRKLQGYEVVETHVTTVPDKDGKPKIKEQKTIKKHVAADTAAIIFTLTNGDPAHWRNRQTTEVTGKDGKDLFKTLSDEDLDKEIADLEKKLKK